jgi:hypothetical protein
MTTLTDTNDPDLWAMEFVRLFGLNPNDTRHVSEWFKSAMETAIKLDKMPGMAHTFPLTEALVDYTSEKVAALAEAIVPEDWDEAPLVHAPDPELEALLDLPDDKPGLYDAGEEE